VVDAGVLLQAVVSGLAAGAVLGLVALGLTLVAGTVRVLHLAHGDVVVGAVLVGVLAVLGTTPVAGRLGAGAATALVVLVLAAGALLAAAVLLLAVRPHLPDPARGRAGDPLGWLAGGVAAGLLLREGLALALPAQSYVVPDPLSLGALTASGVVDLPLGAVVPARVPAVLLLALLAGLLVERLLASRVGAGLRAVADDPDAAALCGVPVQRVVLLAFAAAGLLAGLAALLDAPGRAGVSVDAGVVLGLSGIAAALLGGLGSARGAIAGGLAVGLLQSLVVTYHGGEWSAVVPLALLVVVVAVRPEGARRRRPVGAVA
jgi:branched-chain amino acid transport system permease protein